jgi:hypothetical protein
MRFAGCVDYVHQFNTQLASPFPASADGFFLARCLYVCYNLRAVAGPHSSRAATSISTGVEENLVRALVRCFIFFHAFSMG